MQILIALVGLLGAAAFWWWRLKMIKEAADEVSDAAGRALGKYKRYKFRRKAESSAVEAVEDPVAAAVIMMIATIQLESDLTPAAEAAIENEAKATMGVADPTELMVFAKWVSKHIEDANNVSLRYAKLWTRNLNENELRDLVAMVRRAAEAAGPLSERQEQVIARLKMRLGLDS